MAGRILLALGTLVFVAQTFASTNELTAELKRPKRLQVTLLAQTASNLYGTESRDHEAEGRLVIAPSYKLGANYRLSLSNTLIQNFEQERETRLGNSKLTLSHVPLYLTDDTILIAAGGLRLPTNVEDRHRNTYNGSLVLEPNLITNWTVYGSPFVTVLGAYLTKNTHTYDRNAGGGANTSYSTTGYFGIEKEFLPKFSILLDGDYTYARTYQNSMRTQFSIGQSITYQHDKDLSVTIGHSNAGDALKANGTDYNIAVFDGNFSVVYANIRAVF
jgi:hypothetical protein